MMFGSPKGAEAVIRIQMARDSSKTFRTTSTKITAIIWITAIISIKDNNNTNLHNIYN